MKTDRMLVSHVATPTWCAIKTWTPKRLHHVLLFHRLEAPACYPAHRWSVVGFCIRNPERSLLHTLLGRTLCVGKVCRRRSENEPGIEALARVRTAGSLHISHFCRPLASPTPVSPARASIMAAPSSQAAMLLMRQLKGTSLSRACRH
jgi:hypothetical protein